MRPLVTAAAIFFGLTILLATGCANRVKKEVVGIWLIEDIKISGDTSSVNMDNYRNAIEDQKNLRFELKEDSLISIYTGASEIRGIWYYERRSKHIFVTLEGNIYPTPLGRYRDGKLINSDTNNVGVIINTVFAKQEPVEE